MKTTPPRLAAIALLALAASLPCSAESLASSASSAGSASLGSLSTSSNSSSPKTQVAEGDWRVVEVVALAERPGALRLHMQAAAGAATAPAFFVDLAEPSAAQQRLAVGEVLRVAHRPYGLAFLRQDAPGPAREAVILVLAADWQAEFEPRAVAL
jgi:hypothetical protein